MSALSFAMTRLTTLSSVFALEKSENNNGYLNLNTLKVALDETAQRAFAEFTTGMKMLHKHGARNGCNIQGIAQQNVKLLHSNLKSCKTYRDSISLICSRSIGSARWAWIPLLESSDIKAGFLYLAAGSSVIPNKQDANYTLHQNVLNSPHLVKQMQTSVTQLYLGLMGKTEIECRNEITQSEPAQQIPAQPLMSHLLKKGEVFAENPAEISVHSIKSFQVASLILNVQIKH